MTAFEIAKKVLEDVNAPLTSRGIFDRAIECGLDEGSVSSGDALRKRLRSVLSKDIRKENPTFISNGAYPPTYFFKGREDEFPEIFSVGETLDVGSDENDGRYFEKDLHPLLAYFVHSSPGFSGNKKVYTKTISHNQSKGGQEVRQEWVHPDMVGVYFHFVDLDKDVSNLSKKLKSGVDVMLFSFELKKTITTADCRRYFMQAVSNSSWAHEGYLVIPKIDKDETAIYQELETLSNAFGIGVILLDTKKIDESRVLYAAKHRKELDWGFINKLYKLNPIFKSFMEYLDANIGASKVTSVEFYDPHKTDPIPAFRQTLESKSPN